MTKVPPQLRELLKPEPKPEKGPRSFHIDLSVYAAFMKRVKEEERSASEVVEALMRYYLELDPEPKG